MRFIVNYIGHAFLLHRPIVVVIVEVTLGFFFFLFLFCFCFLSLYFFFSNKNLATTCALGVARRIISRVSHTPNYCIYLVLLTIVSRCRESSLANLAPHNHYLSCLVLLHLSYHVRIVRCLSVITSTFDDPLSCPSQRQKKKKHNKEAPSHKTRTRIHARPRKHPHITLLPSLHHVVCRSC